MTADFLCMSLALASVLVCAGGMFAAITRTASKTMDKPHD